MMVDQVFKRLSAKRKENSKNVWMKTSVWKKCWPMKKNCYARGMELIAGVDEVGRGPLAGPVVAAAVILPKACKIPGLNDSKKIPKSKHKEIYEAVLQNAIAIGIGVKDNQVIDQVNIYEATKLAMMEAIGQLEPQPQHLLIDAMRLDLPISQTSIIKGMPTPYPLLQHPS